MTMTAVELAGKIRLHPRASIFTGTFDARMKMGGALPGLKPHYATRECPVVEYREDGVAIPRPDAAEIECLFTESDFPMPRARQSYSSPRQMNLVQFTFGRAGGAPTQAEYRILREASAKLNALMASRQVVHLVALPILTPGQYGVPASRLYFVGAFSAAGEPLYLHPDAVDLGVLKAKFPTDQHQRSTSDQWFDKTGAPAWYDELRAALSSVIADPKQLHDQILQARARVLLQQAQAPSLEAALERVRNEVPKPPREEAAHTSIKTPEAAAGADSPSPASSPQGRAAAQDAAAAAQTAATATQAGATGQKQAPWWDEASQRNLTRTGTPSPKASAAQPGPQGRSAGAAPETTERAAGKRLLKNLVGRIPSTKRQAKGRER